jgi:chromodomain-helicase-DNA-binding protein 4
MELRKCCNHPWLFTGGLPPPGEVPDGETGIVQLIAASGKLALLDKMMGKLKERGHRVLIYSQFTRTLDLLEDWAALRRWGYQRIDGDVPGLERQRRVDAFNTRPDLYFCFLLSTRSGGLGINLATADTVRRLFLFWFVFCLLWMQLFCCRVVLDERLKSARSTPTKFQTTNNNKQPIKNQ